MEALDINLINDIEPTFIEENGVNRYAVFVVDLFEYKKKLDAQNIMRRIDEAEESVRQDGWVSFESVRAKYEY